MTLPFHQRFLRLAAARSALCVGIDPSAEQLRAWGLADDPAGLRGFCERMVAVCAPLAAVVKPQAAFFLRHGPEGMAVLRDTVAGARRQGALSIIDIKAGDIASTAAAYGEALVGPDSAFAGDAMTASPYLGFASLAPILDAGRNSGAGVFVVVRSSNPEGGEFQHAVMRDGRTVAERLADDVAAWNTAAGAGEDGFVGAVVGATLGDEAGALAARMPNALLLVPGIGAQGATIGDVRRDFGQHFSRTIPSVSRAIAAVGPDAAALRQQVERFINEVRDRT